jgi:hypothetical protein
MNFLQSIKYTQLKESYDFWATPENMSAFYGNQHHRKELEVGITKLEDGYITFQSSQINPVASYSNLETGQVISIKKKTETDEYSYYAELYENCLAQGVRLMIPVYKEDIVEETETLQYFEFATPTAKYGTSISEHQIDVIDDYLRIYAEQVTIIFRELKKLEEKYGCTLPVDMCIPTNFYVDDIGYFWKPSLNWNYRFTDLINETIGFLYNLKKVYGDRAVPTEMLTEAEAVWQTI